MSRCEVKTISVNYSQLLYSYKNALSEKSANLRANNIEIETCKQDNKNEKDSFVQNDDKLKFLEDKYNKFLDKYPQLPVPKKLLEAPSKFLSKITNRFIPPISPVEMYKSGEISYKEALDAVNKLEKRNAITLNLGANIVASLAATTVGLVVKNKVPNKFMFPVVIGTGALIGAVVRPAVKIFARSLNKIDNDAFDKEEIKKDTASGFVNGALGGLNAGFGNGFSAKNILSKIGFEFGKQGLMVAADKILLKQKNNNEQDS